MDDWVIWVIAAGALAVGEIFTLGFFLGPMAVAALVAAVVAAVGAGVALQLAIFVLVAASSVAVLRPIARRHMHTPAQLRTGTAALVGSRAIALERVDCNGGSVKIGGEVWSARTYDEDEVIEPGTRVDVLKIDGATALVSE
jgi:membrane protein implicated in regulation of membrane protease activity